MLHSFQLLTRFAFLFENKTKPYSAIVQELITVVSANRHNKRTIQSLLIFNRPILSSSRKW